MNVRFCSLHSLYKIINRMCTNIYVVEYIEIIKGSRTELYNKNNINNSYYTHANAYDYNPSPQRN